MTSSSVCKEMQQSIAKLFFVETASRSGVIAVFAVKRSAPIGRAFAAPSSAMIGEGFHAGCDDRRLPWAAVNPSVPAHSSQDLREGCFSNRKTTQDHIQWRYTPSRSQWINRPVRLAPTAQK